MPSTLMSNPLVLHSATLLGPLGCPLMKQLFAFTVTMLKSHDGIEEVGKFPELKIVNLQQQYLFLTGSELRWVFRRRLIGFRLEVIPQSKSQNSRSPKDR